MDESQSLEELRKLIIGIIDMDGFLTQKKFCVKNLVFIEYEHISVYRNSKVIATNNGYSQRLWRIN
jgi:hypothetical protein